MADNIPISAGSGTNVATDDVSSVHFQKIKLDVGGDGVSVPVTTYVPVQGQVAHDAVNAGNPIVQGAEAIAHGTNPAAVAAGDATKRYANRAGVPFVIGGHPNIISVEYLWTTAQTDDAIVTIGAGLKIVVTRISVVLDEATTVGVGFRIGFGTSTLPTLATDGNAVAGVLLSHPGLVPGGGITVGDGSGILGVGADNEDLRATTEASTGGAGRMYISYFSIES